MTEKQENKDKDEKIRNLEEIVRELRGRVKELQEEIKMDNLTGLPNMKKYNEDMIVALDDYLRNGNNYSLIFVDIDKFKRLNDTESHEEGDKALKGFADILKGLRKTDNPYRRAGDEFLILVKEGKEDARNLADIIKEKFYNEYGTKYENAPLSLSFGVYSFEEAYDELRKDLSENHTVISNKEFEEMRQYISVLADEEMQKAKGSKNRERTVGNRVSVYKPNKEYYSNRNDTNKA